MKTKIILVTLNLLLLFSCSDDENESNNEHVKYAGYYTITSYKTNVSVDLNNDGISSNELLNEINSFRYTDLEIRPYEGSSNSAKLISYSFPKTEITFDNPFYPDGESQFIGYRVLTSYEFQNNKFIIKETSYIEHSYIDNVESNKTVFLSDILEILGENRLKTSISKEYFDYTIGDWRRLDIEVIFEKVNF